jgi:pimeloyl-ACP methyl ester carboxylesterase
LLVSHATGFTGRTYTPFASTLARRFHVWAIDHRGHGHAGEPPDGDLSWDAMARDLLDAIDAAGLVKPFVYGHSMGGAVALLAAARRPEAFSAAYVFEPAILASRTHLHDWIEAWIAGIRRRREVFESLGDALAYFAARDPYRRFRVDALMAYVTDGLAPLPDGRLRLRCPPDVEADCYAREVVVADTFARLPLRVVVACGVGDFFGAGLVPPALANYLPAAEVRKLAHVGHFGPLEAPELAARDVIDAFCAPQLSIIPGRATG